MEIENEFKNKPKFGLPDLPAIPASEGEDVYNPFEDPDSVWYGIKDFRPRGSRPIPTMRCHRIKKDGTQCQRRGIRGSGLNGTLPCCPHHGGSLPGLKEYAKSVTEAARLQIFASAPDAVQTVYDVMTSQRTPENVKLKAAEMILDRSGIRGGVEIEVEVVDHRELPSDKMRKMLDKLRDTTEEEIVEEPEDLGEVVEEQA